MASPEHLEILKQGVETWNAWRNANPHVRPDLANAELERANLTRANLRDANFFQAHLSQAQLWQSDLTSANLVGAYLTLGLLGGAELTGAKLGSASLNGANLNRANLTDSDLRGSDLRDVDLSDAALPRANLCDATLSSANLTNANLSYSNLERAVFVRTNLQNADLRGANLVKAHFLESILIGTCFAGAKGLTECVHTGPSYLDLRTVEQSDHLPEAFLRGVGWPERLIKYLPTLMGGPPIEFYVCFISYSSIDRLFARKLHDQLQGRGVRCYLDEEDIKVGDDIAEWIDRRVRVADKLLLCASKTSLTSEWVDEEIATARERERRESKRIIIPLNLDGHLLSDGYRGPHSALLRRRLAADFTDWAQDNAKFEASFEKVMLALQAEEDA